MVMTQADWQALYQAGQEGGTSYLETLQAQQQQELAGVPGGGGLTGAAPTGAGAASTANSVGADSINAVEQAYPDLAWMLNVPDLASLIVGAATNATPEAQLTDQLEATTWWQANSDSVRNWIQEVETDPAQAQSDMAEQESAMNATLSQMGFKATQAQLSLLSAQSLALGWSDQQVKDNIAQNTTAGPNGAFTFNYAGVTTTANTAGSLTASVDDIQSEAGKYLVPISNSTAQSFADSLAQGTMTMDGVDAYLQTQAASLYPSISGAIQQGVTPADYVTPYKEVAAQLLGVTADSIDMTKPQYQRALSAPGPGGVPTAMSLYDWQQLLMTDPQYGYLNSVNANDRAASIASGLAEVFGRAPSGPSGSTAFNDAAAPSITGVPIN